jgi:hypothetical protein
MAIIAMTTNNSMSVKPVPQRRDEIGFGIWVMPSLSSKEAQLSIEKLNVMRKPC